ncbi:MAG: hypothetical protein JWO13_2095 [Acidobacteriales bacterium]|nr:hypothetical protein [Terriglobales bacterium]
MRRRFTQTVVLVVIMAMASADAMASTTAAMLRGSGGVSVNGSTVTPTSTVFKGDVIETAPNSVATLSTNGSSILVEQNSSLVFNGENVSFSNGAATVKTTQGMTAKFRCVSITPAQSASRFQLLQMGNMLRVSALEGNLAVLDGRGGAIALASGKEVDIPLDDKDDKGAVADSPNTPNPVGPNIVYQSTRGPAIAGTAGVITVALTAMLAATQHAVSPSGP